MSDIKTAIMDAAERRIRVGGLGGFSFREIAADVGIKSSSVHYHFPTKDDLAAEVVRRWTERTFASIDNAVKTDANPSRIWANAFRGTAYSRQQMCPCTVLAAASQDLPEKVGKEVRAFFEQCRRTMEDQGLSPGEAARLLSTITGALVIANTLGDPAEYDRATSGPPW